MEMISVFPETDSIEPLAGGHFSFCRQLDFFNESILDVFERRQHRQQVEILKDKTKPLRTESG
jgi:hypothetical protein